MDQIPAVKLETRVCGSQLEFKIKAFVVKFPLLEPQDLGVSPQDIKSFHEQDLTVLNNDHFGLKTVNVLPKQSCAVLHSVTKELPAECGFTDWSSMRSYWMKMYGYTLGEEEDSKPYVYYNVTFGDGPMMTYPEWTVRKSNPKLVDGGSRHTVLKIFLSQLQESISLVCGQIVGLSDPVEGSEKNAPILLDKKLDISNYPEKQNQQKESAASQGDIGEEVCLRRVIEDIATDHQYRDVYFFFENSLVP